MRFKMTRSLALVAITILAAALGCDEGVVDGLATGPPGAGPQLQAVGSQQLRAQFGVQLDTPLRVRVLGADGRPVRSAVVRYSVLAGEGVFSSDSTLTDDQGFTQVTFRPLTTGTVLVEASVASASFNDRLQFTVQVLNDPTLGSEMIPVSGNAQTGAVGTLLAEPFVVRVLNPDGFPVDSFPVTFGLVSADSIAVLRDPATGREDVELTVQTDAAGLARVFMRLGSRPGSYDARAMATFNLPSGATTESISFSAFAELSGGAAAQLFAVSGERQTVRIGIADTTAPEGFIPLEEPDRPNPLVVQVLDRFGNPVPGVSIFWHVTDGGGILQQAQTVTDVFGFTSNVVSEVTKGRNLVDATAASTNRVTFVIEAITIPKTEEERPPPDDSGPAD